MAPRFIRDLAVIGVTCFFAVMWGTLLRERIAVNSAPTVMPKYEQLLAEDENERVTTMGIYRGSQRIGDTTTTITRSETGSFYVESKARVEIKGVAALVFRTGGDLELGFSAEISPLSGLRSFRVTCPRLDVAIGGVVREKTPAREKTLIIIGSGRKAVTLVKLGFSSGGRAWNSWVTEKGEVLVQGTPFGLTLRRDDIPLDIEAEMGR